METVILMGPVSVGKSTQAELLSKELGQPRCSYDEVKAGYLKELGFNKKSALAIEEEHGEYAMFCHMNEFRYQVLRKVIDEHPRHIIDLGGGVHCYNESHQINSTKNVFDPIDEIFYLLPSKDLATNINTLPGFKEGFAINAYIMMHPTNAIYAKKMIYTFEKIPEEIMHEIIDQIGKPNKQLNKDNLFNGQK